MTSMFTGGGSAANTATTGGKEMGTEPAATTILSARRPQGSEDPSLPAATGDIRQSEQFLPGAANAVSLGRRFLVLLERTGCKPNPMNRARCLPGFLAVRSFDSQSSIRSTARWPELDEVRLQRKRRRGKTGLRAKVHDPNAALI